MSEIDVVSMEKARAILADHCMFAERAGGAKLYQTGSMDHQGSHPRASNPELRTGWCFRKGSWGHPKACWCSRFRVA